jgi:DNA end-binding protein Ku
MLHKEDLSPIRYARVCKRDGKEVPYDDIVKGYQYQKGEYVIVTEEDFKRADAKKTSTIDILEFSDKKEIDPIYYEKPYFLGPAERAEKPYVLLRDSLKQTGKVGIAKFVLRNKEHLAAIEAFGDIITLYQLRFAEEVRPVEDVTVPSTQTNQEEVKMAITLIDQLTKPFKPQEFKDTYTQELKEIIERKAQGKKMPTFGRPLRPTGSEELMKTLRQSLKETQKV